jgi:PKD repeat protein
VLAGTTPITQFVIPLGTVPAAPFSMTLVYTMPVLPVYAGITFTNQVKINTTYADTNPANDAAQAQTFVGVPPVAAFAPSATTAKINTSVSFTNASVGTPPLTYLWNFGDGSAVTTTVNTTHVYTHSGVFTVTLMASSPWGPDSTYAVAITITPYGNYLPIVIRN